jgi:hypothetical protein
VTTYTYSAELQRVAKETETDTTKFLWEATEAADRSGSMQAEGGSGSTGRSTTTWT